MSNKAEAMTTTESAADGLLEAVITTDGRLVTNDAICHFIEATGDDNEVHMSDTVARTEGFAGHCAHGDLVNHIGIDLIRRKERETGSHPKQVETAWKNLAPVYPGDTVFVRYTKFVSHGLAKIRATIFVLRDEQEFEVATGKIVAVIGKLNLRS